MNDRFFIKDWLISGPVERPYTALQGSDQEMTVVASESQPLEDIGEACLGEVSALGTPWEYHWPGHNAFVEFSSGYDQLVVVEAYAFLNVTVDCDLEVPIIFWAAGLVDLHCNGRHMLRNPPGRVRHPTSTPGILPLRKGSNTLFVRLKTLGLRDTRLLFGLEIQDASLQSKLTVHQPGWPEADEIIPSVRRWMDRLRVKEPGWVVADSPPPVPLKLVGPEKEVTWDAGQSDLRYDPDVLHAYRGMGLLKLRSNQNHIRFDTEILLPVCPTDIPGEQSLKTWQTTGYLKYGYKGPSGNPRSKLPELLCRRLLGQPEPQDERVVAKVCDLVDQRPDCSDFWLAMLLRMMHWDSTTDGEKERVQSTALRFRYWVDEPGSDTMCFNSENHSLLFHSCQCIAGRLFPEACFTNSERTGREQAEIGLQRCRDWFDRLEDHGFMEYNSSTYMPITLGALLNVYDLVGDEDLTRRSGRLIDRIFRTLALHACGGVTAGPQGRVYDDVLLPEKGGAQAILAFACPQVLYAFHPWMCFAASSAYTPPTDLDERINSPAQEAYAEGPVYIHVSKSESCLLTSVELPNPDPDAPGSAKFAPGKQGYQQHTAHATLGPGCHILVNHPGGFFDGTSSRPGYWYGHMSIPWQRQEGHALTQLFVIPDTCPVRFTHIHWPSDQFDGQYVSDHWLVGCKGNSAIAVWCSEPLKPHNDRLTDREYRAYGKKIAWYWVCGDLPEVEAGSMQDRLETFREEQRTSAPKDLQEVMRYFHLEER